MPTRPANPQSNAASHHNVADTDRMLMSVARAPLSKEEAPRPADLVPQDTSEDRDADTLPASSRLAGIARLLALGVLRAAQIGGAGQIPAQGQHGPSVCKTEPLL